MSELYNVKMHGATIKKKIDKKISTIFRKILDYQNYLKIPSAVTGFHYMPIDEQMDDAILTGVPH